jgi:hypothetical protein
VISSVYAGRRVALLTQHRKERVIAPALQHALGCRVEIVTGYDTDRLGTFTREIPRPGTQLETARKKARIGMEMAGLPLGLASEGSFGPDPVAGLVPWNVELVVFIDDERGLEVVGVAQSGANHAHTQAADWAAVEAFARQTGFPQHHLVVRPDSENDPRIRKGIADWTSLAAAFAWAQQRSTSGQVSIEIDLRAHANPTRMNVIRLAAEDLAARLRSPCPSCGLPGFWTVERVAGLPCAACGAPTRETSAEVWGCLKCTHRQTRDRTDLGRADPGRCDACNP